MAKDSSRYFYVSAWYVQGKTVKSLGELRKVLEDMPEPLYWYHSEKNDFANWILGVLGNKKLARRISGADRKRAIKLLKSPSKKAAKKKVVKKKPKKRPAKKKKPAKKRPKKKVVRKKAPKKRVVKKKKAAKKKPAKKKKVAKKKPTKKPAKKKEPATKKAAKRKKR